MFETLDPLLRDLGEFGYWPFHPKKNAKVGFGSATLRFGWVSKLDI